MNVSRETVRKAFASVLQATLVSGGLAQAVYGYQVGDFGGQSPVVVVASGPILRERRSLGPCYHTTATLMVYVFVAYADQASGWTEADAEDRIDAIEVSVADALLANTSTINWSDGRYVQPTQLDGVEIGGKEYRRELITIEMEIVG